MLCNTTSMNPTQPDRLTLYNHAIIGLRSLMLVLVLSALLSVCYEFDQFAMILMNMISF